MKKHGVFVVVMALAIMGVPLVAQEEEKPADKLSVGVEFGASLLTSTSISGDDGDSWVDSLTDATLEDSTLGVSYEDEWWGATAGFAFPSFNLYFVSGDAGEMFPEPALSIDELYGWIKPFGPWVKFTAGIFENTDGIADYTDDIDDFGIGVFFAGEEAVYEAPEGEYLGPALANGFLTEFTYGPVTLSFLLGANYASQSAATLAGDVLGVDMSQMGTDYNGPDDDFFNMDETFYRLGGRVIVDAGVGTFSAVFKTHQWPIGIFNALMVGEILEKGETPTADDLYPGKKATYNTFGGYFDFTAVENLGVTLGYTGFTVLNDAGGADSVLWNGIDLRGTWTGIEGLSLSLHNNITFANGKEKEWMGVLGKDASFFTLYNAIGATKELTDKFSINAVISNIYTKYAANADYSLSENTFGISAKLIVAVTENAEFNIGAAFAAATASATGVDDVTGTSFGIPVGISLSF